MNNIYTKAKKCLQNSLKQQNRYIDYRAYLNRENHIKQLENKGIVFNTNRNKIKLIIGLSCLAIALIPNGLGFIFYPLSFFFLGITIIDLKNYKEIGIKKIKRILK